MNISKLTTAQLEKKIADGKIPADQLETATALLAKRQGPKADKPAKKAAAKKTAKKTATKKEEAAPVVKEKKKKEVPAKKEKAPKVEKEKTEKVPATIEDYDTSDKTVSGLVKKMLMPTGKSTVAGCTYGEANKAVQAKFKRKLHTSEFQRNFDVLKKMGILTEKLPPRYKSAEETKEDKKD